MDEAPRRTCVGCRRTRPQTELFRVCRAPDGIRFDPQRRLPGRGAYICPDPTCIEAAARRGAAPLRRALRGSQENDVMTVLNELTEALRAWAADPSEEHNA